MPMFVVTMKSVVVREQRIEATNMTEAVTCAINLVRAQDVPQAETSYFDEVSAKLEPPA